MNTVDSSQRNKGNTGEKKPGFLAVGNFDSDVGYAWRLMESLWVLMAETLTPMGLHPHVCFPTLSVIPACLSDAGFVVHQYDFSKRDIRSVISQAHFLNVNNIKLLYLTDFKTFDFGYLLYRIVGVKKIIVHDHSPGIRRLPGRTKYTFKRLLHRISLLSADACFAVSPYIKSRMLEVNGIPENKIYCITNGITVAGGQPILRNQGEIKIITVARANYYKGIDFAIKVMAALIKRVGTTSVSYTLFGDGPNLAEFQYLAEKLGVSREVIFAGKITDVSTKLSEFDIAFHPSRGEAMSLAILEYMRAGLPVVVSSNQSVSSFLVDNITAAIYQEEVVDAAVDRLVELISSYEMRRQLGLGGWQAVVEQFNDENMFKAFKVSLLSALNEL